VHEDPSIWGSGIIVGVPAECLPCSRRERRVGQEVSSGAAKSRTASLGGGCIIPVNALHRGRCWPATPHLNGGGTDTGPLETPGQVLVATGPIILMEHGSAFAGAIKQAVEAVINKSFSFTMAPYWKTLFGFLKRLVWRPVTPCGSPLAECWTWVAKNFANTFCIRSNPTNM